LNGIHSHPTFTPKYDRSKFSFAYLRQINRNVIFVISIFPQELFDYKDIEIYKGLFRVVELQVSTKVFIKSYRLSSIFPKWLIVSLREFSRLCFVELIVN